MRVVVTGGAGFIGSALADALITAGHDVAVIDNLSHGRREHVQGRARLHNMDITSPGLAAVLIEEQPEVVFHLAGQVDIQRSMTEPCFDTRANVVGTVNVLQAAVDAGVRRVVFASSGGAIYGDTDLVPTPEDHPALPASAYGAAKHCGEVYGRTFAQVHGLEFVALRYANVYGPRQASHGEAGVVAIFARKLLAGEPAVINGDGTQTRDYVYVDDVVQANLRAAAAPALGSYNIGTGRETDVNEIFRLAAQCAAHHAVAEHRPSQPAGQRRSCLDISRAATSLDWVPRVDLDEGMRRTVAWFREH